ncbi:UNVERIFIED_CONTAM: hypothetical protein FKN15_000333 [Acipenser sinensis]
MQVSSVNDVKICNLSCGKSLPEWLSDRKKRALQKKDVDIQRRIVLIQDFDMPTVSTAIKVSKDGQYILAADNSTDNRTLNVYYVLFLHGPIAGTRTCELVFLHCNRYVEFHSQHGHYYKTRIPKFGRDFSYHYPSCDLYFVGARVEGLPSVSALKFNGALHMAVGTSTGQALGPAPRWCSFLDNLTEELEENPETTVYDDYKFVTRKDLDNLGLAHLIGSPLLRAYMHGFFMDIRLYHKVKTMANPFAYDEYRKDKIRQKIEETRAQRVQIKILMYDLRSNRPLLVKNHHYGLPIKSIQFQDQLDLILSADSKIIKMWNKDTALGPAPRWCSFLDNLTEELEENPETTVYDDYKFVTRKDLDNLGLAHLIGSPLLRAYMHGFFMDIRLYHKVKTMANPFAYDEYRKDKIRQKIEETRAQRVQIKNLPNILSDDRFKVMFENPDYQVDEASEEFRLLNPIVSKVNEKRKKKLRKLECELAPEQKEEEEPEGKPSDAESSESSDNDKGWVEEVRKQRKLMYFEERAKRQERKEKAREDRRTSLEPKFFEIKAGEEFRSFKDAENRSCRNLLDSSAFQCLYIVVKFFEVSSYRTTLEDRLKFEEKSGTLNVSDATVGSKQLTFKLKKVRFASPLLPCCILECLFFTPCA